MGLMAGALSFRRYKVMGELPDGFRDLYIESIGRYVLRENDKARTKDDNLGWVSILDPADIDLHLNKFLYNQFLVLALRVDRKRVPARYLKIMVDRKVREVMKAAGLERMGAQRRKEIKEAVEEELLGRALPVVATFDMMWDIDKMEVWFFATSDAICDLFRGLFKDTFGLELHRLKPADWMMPPFTREELEALVGAMAPAVFRG